LGNPVIYWVINVVLCITLVVLIILTFFKRPIIGINQYDVAVALERLFEHRMGLYISFYKRYATNKDQEVAKGILTSAAKKITSITFLADKFKYDIQSEQFDLLLDKTKISNQIFWLYNIYQKHKQNSYFKKNSTAPRRRSSDFS
jgi:hypothetical protein